MNAYSKEDTWSSKEEDNHDNSKEVMFMALIQDDSSKYGNYCISIKGSKVKGTHEIISKPLKKLSYNGIYMSPRKSEVKQKSRNLE